MRKRATKRILVSIPTAAHTQRLKLEGVLKYAKEKRGDIWTLQLDIGGFARQRLLDLPGWKCDGIIAYVDNPKDRDTFANSPLPTVLIEPFARTKTQTRPNIVSFVNDYRAEGETAARHFLERHFKHFAYVGTAERTPWNELRRDGFVECLSRNGRECTIYPPLSPYEREDFALEMPRLARWLKERPSQTALFVAHDVRARQILTAANAMKISIPQEIAIVSVDNDELLCETATPPLSSIPTSDTSLGYACGRALEELINRRAIGRTIVTHHTRVISRTSSDITVLGDPFVAKALSWARNHLSDGITSDDIAAGIGYSKRLLQARTQKALGTTLGEEVRRMRLLAAAELLSNTDRSIGDIADACGFANVSHLSMRFTKAYHMTPLAYRRNMRENIAGSQCGSQRGTTP